MYRNSPVTLNNPDLSIHNKRTPSFPGIAGSILEVRLKGQILRDTEFDMSRNFPYSDTGGQFYFSGQPGSFPFRDINSYMLQPPKVIFTGGLTNKVSFDARCNSLACRGSMTMLYWDLKIEVVKNRKAEGNKEPSMVANVLISNNTHRGRMLTFLCRFGLMNFLYNSGRAYYKLFPLLL